VIVQTPLSSFFAVGRAQQPLVLHLVERLPFTRAVQSHWLTHFAQLHAAAHKPPDEKASNPDRTCCLSLQVEPLNWGEWLVSVGVGALSIPISLAVRLLGRVTCDRGSCAGCCQPARARFFGTGRAAGVPTEAEMAAVVAPPRAADGGRLPA
jgi:hypothetical protein